MEIKLPCDYRSLSWQQRREVRLEYIKRQKQKCYHCGANLNGPPTKTIREMPISWSLFPEGFLKHPVHLHHSHDTGMTIGAVHNYCNAVLWQYHGE